MDLFKSDEMNLMRNMFSCFNKVESMLNNIKIFQAEVVAQSKLSPKGLRKNMFKKQANNKFTASKNEVCPGSGSCRKGENNGNEGNKEQLNRLI